MSTHLAVPLFVAGVHFVLGLGALVSGGERRAQWLVAALAAVLGVAALAVFQIRHAPDAAGGLLGQRVLNITFALTPAVYYHLVRVVTRTEAAGRAATVLAYAGAGLFTLVGLLALPLLVRAVVRTPREWAPVSGLLGLVLLVFYLAVFAATLRPLHGSGRPALLGASLVMVLAPLANVGAILLVYAGLVKLDVPSLRMPSSVIFIALVWFATRENAT